MTHEKREQGSIFCNVSVTMNDSEGIRIIPSEEGINSKRRGY